MNSTSSLLERPRLWYDPLQKGVSALNLHMDALGRSIREGDVCGYASRRRSEIFLEPVVIREVLPGGVKGDKLVRDGRGVKKVRTKLIRVPQHLIITGLSEEEAMTLVRIK